MSRLREILLANRDDPQLTAAELCPFCHNQNPQCRYFDAELAELSCPAEVETLRPDEPAADAGDDPFPADSFWGQVRRMLAGTRITLTTKAGEVEMDLGESMGKGFYYLDLFAPLIEIPRLAKIARKFGLFADEDKKTAKSGSSRFVAVPAPVLQAPEGAVFPPDEAAREAMDFQYLLAMDCAAEGMTGYSYRDYQWTPLCLDPDAPKITPPGGAGDDPPNALALVNWKGIYVREEALYRWWADLEERLALDNCKIAGLERQYPCGDLDAARRELLRELEMLRREVMRGIADPADGSDGEED